MKNFVAIIVFSFGLFSVNFSIAQSSNYADSIQASLYKTPEQKLELESAWLRALINSQDSLLNLMATRADQELKNQTDVRYAMFIFSSLLETHKDTALHVIANNLAACPYFNTTSFMGVITGKYSFPVIKTIEKAPLLQVNILKNYLQRSDFLSKLFSNDEVGILHYLLIQHDPAFEPKLNPARYTGQALKNVQSILAWKEE